MLQNNMLLFFFFFGGEIQNKMLGEVISKLKYRDF